MVGILFGFALGFASGVLWLAFTVVEKFKTHDGTYDGIVKWIERPVSKSPIENTASGKYHLLMVYVGLVALNTLSRKFYSYMLCKNFYREYLAVYYFLSELISLILYPVICFYIFKFAIRANQHRLIFGASFLLFLGSFFSGLFLLKFAEMPFEIESLYFVLWDSVPSIFFFSLLLAFCPISAGAILWAYSKNHFSNRPRVIFSLGLLVSMISIIIGIWLSIYMRDINPMDGDLGLPTQIDIDHYFPSSLGTILLLSGIIIVILLQKPDWKKSVKLVFTR